MLFYIGLRYALFLMNFVFCRLYRFSFPEPLFTIAALDFVALRCTRPLGSWLRGARLCCSRPQQLVICSPLRWAFGGRVVALEPQIYSKFI